MNQKFEQKIYHANVNVELMGKKCNSDQWWNNDKCRCECKNVLYLKKLILGILLHVVVKMKNI